MERPQITAVVSPTGMLHAVREGVLATACGVDTTRQRRRQSGAALAWRPAPAGFGEYRSARTPGLCQRCVECLDGGMGPGS